MHARRLSRILDGCDPDADVRLVVPDPRGGFVYAEVRSIDVDDDAGEVTIWGTGAFRKDDE